LKVTGSATLSAARQDVWAALNDPAVLVRTIPGCRQLEEIAPGRYRMTLYAGVASVKGVYTGEVALTDQEEPSAFVLRASGAGGPGTVQADVAVTLAENGTGSTHLTYDADAVVGGMVGGVGQRMLTGVAKKTAGEFFAAVDDVLAGGTPAPGGQVGVSGESPSESPSEVASEAASATSAGAPVTSPPHVYQAPPARAGSEFARGAVLGAAVALLGALVGGFVASRRR